MGYAKIKVAGELWKLISPQPGYIIEIISNDVPPSAKIESIGYDVSRDCLEMVLSGDCFEKGQMTVLNGPQFKVRKK